MTGVGYNVVVKVSLVNENGHIVLDTLVRPDVEGQEEKKVEDIEGYRSMWPIHGIRKSWLEDAPTFESVRHHIMELSGKVDPSQPSTSTPSYLSIDPSSFDPLHHPIFIGHGVVLDLKVMGISEVPYICTQQIDFDIKFHHCKKLKDLSAKYLNASI